MRWRPPSERVQLCLVAPIAIPVGVMLAVWLSPLIAWAFIEAKLRKRQRGRGRHIWFAWHPVKFDAFWHNDVESQWFWLERVERRRNSDRWQYWPVGFVDPYEAA